MILRTTISTSGKEYRKRFHGLRHCKGLTPRKKKLQKSNKYKHVKWLIRALSDRIKINKSGKEYRVPIHGLRHCTKCTQCLNRNENASRRIFFSFRNHYKHGCLPRFLKRKRVVYSGESVPNTKSSIKKRCTVHVKKTLQSNS